MRIAMLCPCGKQSPRTEPPILDIEKILQDFAWKDFKEKSGPVEKIFLRRRDFEIEVPMNYFHFEDSIAELKPRTSTLEQPTAIGHSIPETAILSTSFRNNTKTSQTYKFRVERTRKATITVTFQKGFSIGGKAHFKLTLPKTAGVGGEMDMRLQISKTTGETFEETMTFEVNSDINVSEESNYTANVAFTDKEISAGFTVYTKMTMPNETAPITIRRKRDHVLYDTVFVGSLREVFENYKSNVVCVDESAKDSKFHKWAVQFTTTGIVEGVRLSGQKIYLDSTKIGEGESGQTFQNAAASMIADARGVQHPGLFGVACASDSDEAKDDSTNDASVSFRSINECHSETRILKGPQIPTIITTAPSSQETSPPSDTGTNTSVESQSLPDDKNGDVLEKSAPTTPSPSPGKSVLKDCSKDGSTQKEVIIVKEGGSPREGGKVPLKETKSLSKGSKDDPKAPVKELKSLSAQKPSTEQRSPSPIEKPSDLKSSQSPKTQNQEPKPLKIPKSAKDESIKIDQTKLKAEPQRVKPDTHKGKDLSRFKPDPTKVQNIRDFTKQFPNPKEFMKQTPIQKEFLKQTSIPKELMKQTSNPKELFKQTSNPKELTKQLSNPRELMKQISNPEGDKVFNDDKPLVRKSYRHETLERMERVSSLSERPRVLPKSGSLPRGTVHSSIEPQSSEEDSTSSSNKLSKCTSV